MASLKTEISAASGVISTYEDAEELIEKIASYKANQYGKIGYLEPEDVKQEVRLKCYKELHKYDPSRTNAHLFTFLSVCADNRIRDLRRKLVFKDNKPCLRCPFWDPVASKKGQHDCLMFEDKLSCDKFSSYQTYVKTKLNSNRPLDITDKNVYIYDNGVFNEINKIDVLDFVYNALPSGLNPLFQKLMESNFNTKKLKPKEREELLVVLKEIFEKKGFYDD